MNSVVNLARYRRLALAPAVLASIYRDLGSLKQSLVAIVLCSSLGLGDDEFFLWRPYVLAVEGWSIPKFYKDKEEWTIVGGKNLDTEMESFVRCLREMKGCHLAEGS
ncbi:hypothetical protein KY285_030376 [Solanum tuberosum]|nr:hypothetical protein KY285_030376 [Solanum tuberosum]